MNRNQTLLRHFLATLAYQTAKALRGAPAGYEAFQPGHRARTPRQVVWHMSGVLNYAIGLLSQPRDVLTDRATYSAEVERFFASFASLPIRFGERRTLLIRRPSSCFRAHSRMQWRTRDSLRFCAD